LSHEKARFLWEKKCKKLCAKNTENALLKGSTGQHIFSSLFPIRTGLSSSDTTIVSVEALIALKYASGSGRVGSGTDLLQNRHKGKRRKRKKGNERRIASKTPRLARIHYCFFVLSFSSSFFLIALILSIAKDRSTNDKFIGLRKSLRTMNGQLCLNKHVIVSFSAR